MEHSSFMKELRECTLCEHRCGVNRLEGETGICRGTMPVISSATLHPAPPESYTVFTAGCNFKCLHCQNWTISQYPDNEFPQRGYVDPRKLAQECTRNLATAPAKFMGADRIFFSGGEPTIHLPYIERVVEEAREMAPGTKVNFDTNGYMRQESLLRVLAFTTSLTYDLKAYSDDVHMALTGVPSGPVLRNAAYIGRHAKDKLWEYRIVVIPEINEEEIGSLCDFIADIDTGLPVCFIAFRPNFVLQDHPGATMELMDRCVAMAKERGLEKAYWSGRSDLPGRAIMPTEKLDQVYQSRGARMAATYVLSAGCKSRPRRCSSCDSSQTCRIKSFIPRRQS